MWKECATKRCAPVGRENSSFAVVLWFSFFSPVFIPGMQHPVRIMTCFARICFLLVADSEKKRMQCAAAEMWSIALCAGSPPWTRRHLTPMCGLLFLCSESRDPEKNLFFVLLNLSSQNPRVSGFLQQGG